MSCKVSVGYVAYICTVLYNKWFRRGCIDTSNFKGNLHVPINVELALAFKNVSYTKTRVFNSGLD